MTIQTDIVTALNTVTSNRLYPQALPQELNLADGPAVVYRILNKNPVGNFCGTSALAQYSVAFDCWASTYSAAVALATLLATEIDNNAMLTSYRDASPGEDFEPFSDAFVEPVYFGFWHSG